MDFITPLGILLAFAAILLILLPIGAHVSLRFSNVKTNLTVAGGYLALLIILTLGVAFLPAAGLVHGINANVNNFTTKVDDVIENNVEHGNFAAPKGYRVYHSSFTPNGKSVTLSVDKHFYSIFIKAKGKDVPDDGSGKADVYIYTASISTVTANKSSFSLGNMNPAKVAYKNGRLSVRVVEHNLSFCRFDDTGFLKQFVKGGGSDVWSSSTSGDTLLYILLPPGITAKGP